MPVNLIILEQRGKQGNRTKAMGSAEAKTQAETDTWNNLSFSCFYSRLLLLTLEKWRDGDTIFRQQKLQLLFSMGSWLGQVLCSRCSVSTLSVTEAYCEEEASSQRSMERHTPVEVLSHFSYRIKKTCLTPRPSSKPLYKMKEQVKTELNVRKLFCHCFFGWLFHQLKLPVDVDNMGWRWGIWGGSLSPDSSLIVLLSVKGYSTKPLDIKQPGGLASADYPDGLGLWCTDG